MLMWVATLSLLVEAAHATQWRLAFEDNFSSPKLSTSQWNVRRNQSHCCALLGRQELELYLSDEVLITDGQLQLRTRRRTELGPDHAGKIRPYNFTSGWVDTKGKFSQLFGKFEANCSLPSSAARGIWPAFWLLPDNDMCWPTGGEVDIFEFNGNPLVDSVFASYHWAEPGKEHCDKDRAPIPGKAFKPKGARANWQTDWFVYGVEWTNTTLTYTLNGESYFTRERSRVAMPPAPMYIILNQGVDPTLFSPTAAHPGKGYDTGEVRLKVDWVRVWEAV
jgi:beta-glucanase (GH16 family)